MKKLLPLLLPALVAVALVACGDDDEDRASVTTTTESTTSTTATPPRPSTTAAPTLGRVDDPVATAQSWIAAIANGKDDVAIGLTAPRSLEAFGGPEGFVESDTALAEGWGAWDLAEDLEVEAISLDDATAIVVLHGMVSQEGPPREGWAALPVVATEDGDRVEPFLDLGNVEADPPGGTIEAEHRFAAYVLGGRDVTFIVDTGQPVEPATQGADGDQQLAEVDVEGLEPGSHVLTVVVRRGEEIMARTFEYTVAG
jgi:hypothetical protein